MGDLQVKINQARLRWISRERRDGVAKKMWHDISWKFFSGDSKAHQTGMDRVIEMNAFDAVCTLIQSGEYGIEFVDDAPPYGREVAGLRLIQIASQAPYDHVIQELFIMGAFDRLLIAASSTPEMVSLPEWASERLIGILSSMVAVDGGEYSVGNVNADAFEDERGLRPAFVESFEVGAYPVTQAFYASVMRDNPSVFHGGGRPVDSVSWFDAVAFCNALSQKAGLEKAYRIGRGDNPDIDWNTQANGYRLLTEAEWEIAAKTQRDSAYSGSERISDVGWSAEDHLKETCAVGRRQPNSWGIYDLSGLVYEWVYDWYGAYPEALPYEHIGPLQGIHRCRRGGSFLSQPRMCQVWSRSDRRPNYRHEATGFRLARNIY